MIEGQDRVVRHRKDSKTVLEMPLFPDYVFKQPRLRPYENIGYTLEAVRVLVRCGAAPVVNPRLIPAVKST
jgi:hypothetical protein